MRRGLLYGALLLLYLLHNDVWWWNDSSLWFGLPIGMSWHVLLCLGSALVMALLVRREPPR
jgi:hypothetical protein